MAENRNVKDDLRKIKNWLRKQEVDEGEEIPSKSKERVYSAMARQIRQIKPLPTGSCHLCGFYTEDLIPIPLRICPRCFNRFTRRGGNQRILNIQFGAYSCDVCKSQAIHTVTINPLICYRCLRRIGKVHRIGSN